MALLAETVYNVINLIASWFGIVSDFYYYWFLFRRVLMRAAFRGTFICFS